MRILVVLANYGTKNDAFLKRVLNEYRRMPYQVDLVVLSNFPKDLGGDVQVITGLPYKDSRALPFAHKKLFAERIQRYDIFIYSEDDTLLTGRNIEAYLKVTAVLRDDEIAGFLRSETDAEGRIYLSSIHNRFHWTPGSVRKRGDYTFAVFTNPHAALYALTREQLKRAIASSGFLVEPHEGLYSLMVSAATDPYTQCGMERVVCISHLDDFILPHLPNVYLGRMGLERAELNRQLQRLLDVQENRFPAAQLLNGVPASPLGLWAKSYYERANPALLSAVPEGVKSVLSLGCGWGANEAELMKQGKSVDAVPLDSVIAATAEARGVEMVYGDFAGARAQLDGRRFDCLLISNLLHLVEDPVAILASFGELVNAKGSVVIQSPNFAYLPTQVRRLRKVSGYEALGDFAKTGIQPTDFGRLRDWLSRCGFRVVRYLPRIPAKLGPANRVSLGLAQKLLAEDFILVGNKS